MIIYTAMFYNTTSISISVHMVVVVGIFDNTFIHLYGGLELLDMQLMGIVHLLFLPFVYFLLLTHFLSMKVVQPTYLPLLPYIELVL